MDHQTMTIAKQDQKTKPPFIPNLIDRIKARIRVKANEKEPVELLTS